MKAYADRHGYDFHADCSEISAPARSPMYGAGVEGYLPIRGFVKLDLMLHFLDPEACRRDYDWVVWLDADMLITNPTIALDKWMKSPLVLPFDANGINATVIMARNMPLVRDLLWAANSAGRTMFLQHQWAEMEALRYFLQTPPYAGMCAYYSVKELCAMPDHTYPIPAVTVQKYEWTPGDFAVHFSAMSVEARVEYAKRWLRDYNCSDRGQKREIEPALTLPTHLLQMESGIVFGEPLKQTAVVDE